MLHGDYSRLLPHKPRSPDLLTQPYPAGHNANTHCHLNQKQTSTDSLLQLQNKPSSTRPKLPWRLPWCRLAPASFYMNDHKVKTYSACRLKKAWNTMGYQENTGQVYMRPALHADNPRIPTSSRVVVVCEKTKNLSIEVCSRTTLTCLSPWEVRIHTHWHTRTQFGARLSCCRDPRTLSFVELERSITRTDVE